MTYLLDTNVILHYVRKTSLSVQIEKELQIFGNQFNVLTTSVVTKGELKAIAVKNKWGKGKLNTLEYFLAEFIVIAINIESVIEYYAEIDAFSQGKLPQTKAKFSSRNMGKNDLWIAATAAAFKIPLVTVDKDFNHLDKIYLELLTVN